MSAHDSGLAEVCIPGWTSRVRARPPYVVGVLPGEGIGPEVVGASLTVLDAVAEAFGLEFELRMAEELGPPGPYGQLLDEQSEQFFESVFALGAPVLCGAVGGRFVYDVARPLRPLLQARAGAPPPRAGRRFDRAARTGATTSTC